MANNPDEVAVVTTESIVGETIAETFGYVNSLYLSWFILRKAYVVDRAIDKVIENLQYKAFKDGANAVVNVRTSVELQGQYLLYTRVTVFAEGTMVKLSD